MDFDELSTIFKFLTLFSVVVPGVLTTVVVAIGGKMYDLDDFVFPDSDEVGVDIAEGGYLPSGRKKALLLAFKRQIADDKLSHGGLKGFVRLFIQLLLKNGHMVNVPGINKFVAFFINYVNFSGDLKKSKLPGYLYTDKAPSDKFVEKLHQQHRDIEAKQAWADQVREKNQLIKIRNVMLAHVKENRPEIVKKVNQYYNRMLKTYEDGCKMLTVYGFKYNFALTSRYNPNRDIAIIPKLYLRLPEKGAHEDLVFCGKTIGTVDCVNVDGRGRWYHVHMYDNKSKNFDYDDQICDSMVWKINNNQNVTDLNYSKATLEEGITRYDHLHYNSFAVALPHSWYDFEDTVDIDFNSLVGGLNIDEFINDKNEFPEKFNMRDDVTGDYCEMYGPATSHCWLYCLNEVLYHEYLKGNMNDHEVDTARHWIMDFVEAFGNGGENHLIGDVNPPNLNNPVPHMHTVNFAVNQNGQMLQIHAEGGLNEPNPRRWPVQFDAYEKPLPGSLSLHKVKLLYQSFADTFNIPIVLYACRLSYKQIADKKVPTAPASTECRYGPDDGEPYRVAVMSVQQANGQAVDQVHHDLHAYFGQKIVLAKGNYLFMNIKQYIQYCKAYVGETCKAIYPRLHKSHVVDFIKRVECFGDRPYNVVQVSRKVANRYTGDPENTYLVCTDAVFRQCLEGEPIVDDNYVEALLGVWNQPVRSAPIKFVKDKSFGGTDLNVSLGTKKALMKVSKWRYFTTLLLWIFIPIVILLGYDTIRDLRAYTCYPGERGVAHVFTGDSWETNGCRIHRVPRVVGCKFAYSKYSYTLSKMSREQMEQVVQGRGTSVIPSEYDSMWSDEKLEAVECYLNRTGSYGFLKNVVNNNASACFEGKIRFNNGVYDKSETYPYCVYYSSCEKDSKCYTTSMFMWFWDRWLYLCSFILFAYLVTNIYYYRNLTIYLDYGLNVNNASYNYRLVPLVLGEACLEECGMLYKSKGAAQAAYRALKVTKSPTIVADMLSYFSMTGMDDWLKINGDVSGLYDAVAGIYECPSIPFNYPDIPCIHGSAVKLDDIRPVKMEYEMLCCPPSMMNDESLYIHYNRSTAESIDHALFCRLMLGRPDQHVNMSALYSAYSRWYDLNIDLFSEARELGLDELIKLHPRGSRYKGVTVGYEEALNTVFTGFIKCEPYDIDKKVKPNRAIISPGKKATVWGLKFTHLIEKGLHKSPHFSKAKNSQETAIDLENIWKKFTNPLAVGCDFTQFENGVNVPVLIGSMSMFHTLCGMPEEYIEKWLDRTIYFCKRWKVVLKGKRISGEYQTSLGNMIIVGALLQRVVDLAKEYGKNFDYYSAGDDCMIFCEKEDKELAVRLIQRVVAEFGMLIKIEAFYEDFEDIHFCQQYPVLTDKGYWMINDIKRVFDKLFVQPKVIVDTKHQRNRLACLGDYLNYMYPNVPFVQQVVKNFYSYWDREHRYNKAFNSSHDWHIMEIQNSTDGFTPNYKIVDYHKMLEKMKFPEWIGEYYQDYFSRVNVFDIKQHRDIEFEYDVEKKDMFIQLSFFERHFLKPKFENTSTVDDLHEVREDRQLNHVTRSQFDKLVHISLPIRG